MTRAPPLGSANPQTMKFKIAVLTFPNNFQTWTSVWLIMEHVDRTVLITQEATSVHVEADSNYHLWITNHVKVRLKIIVWYLAKISITMLRNLMVSFWKMTMHVLINVQLWITVKILPLHRKKLYCQMDQNDGKNVYLKRNIWEYNRSFVKSHTNKQTFHTKYLIQQLKHL